MRELWDVYGEDCAVIPGKVTVRGKHDLLHALRMQRQQQKEANANAEQDQT